MRSLLTHAAEYWKAWNRVYPGQIYNEEEPYAVEQIRSELSFRALRGQSPEAESLAKSALEEGILPVQAGLHRPL
jgi:hypothetical protein